MDAQLPEHINFWITSSSKHDCFFNVGPESGPKERIGAIKIFLIGHSEVLRKMLDESPLAETGDISVTDTDPETFRNFLVCIYGATKIVIGELSYEKCLDLLYLCEKYLMLHIREKISKTLLKLHKPLSTVNVLLGLSKPACLKSESLSEAFSKAIQDDTSKFLKHHSFLNLDSNGVLFIVQQNILSIKEIELWKAVLMWARGKVNVEESEDLRSSLKDVLQHIRFCIMDANDFCKDVIPCNVLTQEEVFEICKSIGTKAAPNLEKLCCSIVERKKITESPFLFRSFALGVRA